jgi:formylglycine-generating enzyme required for sulfatase activity
MQPSSLAPRTIGRRRDRHGATLFVLSLLLPACLGSAPLLGGCLLSIDDSLLAGDAAATDATTSGDAADAAEGSVVVEAGAPTDADTGAAADVDAASVEAGCPPAMVQVPAPGGGKAFCVDAKEVTNKAYRAFLTAAEPPATGSQITECAWNSTYTVGTLGADDLPVGGLDWCDAYAYCAWAGKHLCGAVAGGPLAYGSFPSTASRWYLACSHGGAQGFPYGATYDPTACNGRPLDAGTPLPVGSLTTCQGGYPGLFDMSGNVSELIDSCDTTPLAACGSGPECDLCLLVGGGFLSGAGDDGDIACTYSNLIYRNAHYVDNGVRCCADLP